MLEIFIHRPKEDVETAIIQFVARRSYRLSKPWYLEGIRIESSLPTEKEPSGGFWASMFDVPTPPRVDVETKRRRSGTRARIVIANTPESTRLAYELHSFLLDEKSYDREIPTLCPRCSTPVLNVTARFCGRCGNRLVSYIAEQAPYARPLPPAPIAPVALKSFVAAPPIINQERRVSIENEMQRSFEWTAAAGEDSRARAKEGAADFENDAPPELSGKDVGEGANPALDAPDPVALNAFQSNKAIAEAEADPVDTDRVVDSPADEAKTGREEPPTERRRALAEE
ncbi:MAG TPA: hypothetical protein VNT79_12575 [Phycisphaerae bacterium]|nr:hypothetical protein [Phycisphaerae bacterium]